MKIKRITAQQIELFYQQLTEEEKSPVTIEKYLRDVRAFAAYCSGETVTKDRLIAYKQHLTDDGYAIGSINSMIISINRFLAFIGRSDCRVKCLREQRQVYQREDKQLTKAEYMRLINAAKGDERLCLLLQAICATGIRVSELQFFTVEDLRQGEVIVTCKNKTRNILVPGELKKKLLSFAARHGIISGVIFRSRTGKPLDRSNIWAMMKRLCVAANVKPGKVFPHNLRKLFARTFYGIEKDIAKLADILGHSSINTTRIYIMTTSAEHQRKIERLGLVV